MCGLSEENKSLREKFAFGFHLARTRPALNPTTRECIRSVYCRPLCERRREAGRAALPNTWEFGKKDARQLVNMPTHPRLFHNIVSPHNPLTNKRSGDTNAVQIQGLERTNLGRVSFVSPDLLLLSL